MQTYYQKHRHINAFQFDGTWRQLMTELPNSVIRSIIDLQYDIVSPTGIFSTMDKISDYWNITYTKNHQIQTLQLTIAEWPMSNIKVNHPIHYWCNKLSTNKVKQMMKINRALSNYNYKYDNINNILHRGDYVIAQYDNDEYNNYMGHPYQLRFYRKKDFKAHWSTLRRKERHYANH